MMNLHIVPDSKFTETFYANIKSLGLLGNNSFIVNTAKPALQYITNDIPFGPVYSEKFNSLVGDTSSYKEVYIHLFNPLMYRWVARHQFRKLSWCVWGTDLYHLPGLSRMLYEPETWNHFRKGYFTKQEFFYQLKLRITSFPFRKKAYSKVQRILTWMKTEYDFSVKHLPGLKASWDFFFYENSLPYQKLDDAKASFTPEKAFRRENQFLLMVGNSGTDTNNHIEAIRTISSKGIAADLVIPVSYGDENYVRFLKDNTTFYKSGRLIFLDEFMGFGDYVNLLLSMDGLVMNHLRPQGYGNILMMMYLDKPVFMNPRNFSLSDLEKNDLKWKSLAEIKSQDLTNSPVSNRNAVIKLLSHERLEGLYSNLFR